MRKSKSTRTAKEKELTPVDDVRRIREGLVRKAGGDIRKLAESARRAARPYYAKLGLKTVQPPLRKLRNGTHG